MYRSSSCLLPRRGFTCSRISLAYPRELHTTSVNAAATSNSSPPPTAPQSHGTIEEIFSSFHNSPPFPARFADLKRQIWTDGMIESWRQVLKELEEVTSRVIAQGNQVSPCVPLCTCNATVGSSLTLQSVPDIPYSSLERGLSKAELDEVKSAGCVIVRGAVPQEEAIGWDRSIREYITANKEKVRGTFESVCPMF